MDLCFSSPFFLLCPDGYFCANEHLILLHNSSYYLYFRLMSCSFVHTYARYYIKKKQRKPRSACESDCTGWSWSSLRTCCKGPYSPFVVFMTFTLASDFVLSYHFSLCFVSVISSYYYFIYLSIYYCFFGVYTYFIFVWYAGIHSYFIF